MLISIETFKQQVLEWTGHKRLGSLDRYIRLTFAELAGLPPTIDAVQGIRNAEATGTLVKIDTPNRAGQMPTPTVERAYDSPSGM